MSRRTRGARLPRAWYASDATDVAPRLLNKLLVVGECRGRIVEVEAYLPDDPASHSFRGPTKRNQAMFGLPGTLYVYLSHGIHRCANVVTGPVGSGQAVLLRAVEPVSGIEGMRARRGDRVSERHLTDGPGKLCQAFGIGLDLDGTDLVHGPVAVVDDGVPPPAEPLITGRIGVSRAVELPWRWVVPAVEGGPGLSGRRGTSSRGGGTPRAAPRSAGHGASAPG